MRVKVYVVDIPFPRWVRRALFWGGVPLAIIGLGALVYAAAVKGQLDFFDGQVLSAKDMNDHLAELQKQITEHAAALQRIDGHAARHRHGGGDEVATDAPTAFGIPKAGGAGTLATGWIPTHGNALHSNEAWHVVGATNEPAFQNSWRNYGGAYEVVRFRRDAQGGVHVVGIAKSGSTNTVIFTLPEGFRPSIPLQRTAVAYTASTTTFYPASIMVYANGDVSVIHGGPSPASEVDIGIQFFLD
jgi:hypothetical protein